MKKMKVMTVVGTRPEIIRLSRILAKLDTHCDHVFVHTGQNYDYELNEIFFNDLNIPKPNYFLDSAGSTAAETIGRVIISVDKVLEAEKPEALLVLGDTNSCLAVIPAKRRKIPVFHMEAGNRCFDQRVPEEINRKIVDHIADINLTYSDIAREYLLKEGIASDRIIKTGSPMFEVLTYYKKGIEASTILSSLDLIKENYFVVSCHREENIDVVRQLMHVMESLNAVAECYNKPIIVSTHPRTKNRLESSGFIFNQNIQFLKPMGFKDYVHLQMHAMAVLSDSGTIFEEASIMNFPALAIREAHERPEAMEEASVMLSGIKKERILQCLELLLNQPQIKTRGFRMVADYTMPNVSDKLIRLLHSYTDYVNANVWKN